LPSGVYKDILRAQVVMEQAGGMGRRQTRSELFHQFNGAENVVWSAGSGVASKERVIGQELPLVVREDGIRPFFGVPWSLNGQNIFVGQLSGRFGSAQKAVGQIAGNGFWT
jgi:hypothetical protein